MNISIKWKLVAVITAVAAFVSIAEISIFFAYNMHTGREDKRIKMRTIAEIVGLNSVAALEFKDRKEARSILGSLVGEPSILEAYLFDEYRSLLGEYIKNGEMLSVPLLQSSTEYDFFEDGFHIIHHPIFWNDREIGLLYIKSDMHEEMSRTRRGAFLLAFVGFALFLASILLAIWLQRYIVKPIRELGQTMIKITATNDFGVRATKSADDEFGTLVSVFNFMLSEVEKRGLDLQHQMGLLERTNKELDQFVYIASHDLKAPLRAVENLSRMIVKALKGSLPPDKNELLELLQNRVKRMEKLLDDLLQYSRVGRFYTSVEIVDTDLMVKEIVELLSPPTHITVTMENLPKLNALRTPLEQTLRNLIGNAIKHHTGKKGKIIVRAKDFDDQFIEFSVCDDGPGIAPEYHEKIFQMFQTLKPRDEVEGSGMGLALVKKIVEDQKGKVWVVSAEGKGACFHFTWPKTVS